MVETETPAELLQAPSSRLPRVGLITWLIDTPLLHPHRCSAFAHGRLYNSILFYLIVCISMSILCDIVCGIG